MVEPIRTLSLFSGAGGLDIGFRQAGFHAVEMVELEERFVATLHANCGDGGLFGDARPICRDVREYAPPAKSQIDFIIGGPPCQTFSAAGRRAGGVLGTTDERGQLFMTYVALLKRLKPRGFLFENVAGITGANGGRDWLEICAAFRSAGYRVTHRVLDSADFGVPQHRERMFIVGTRDAEFAFPRPTHGPDSPGALPHYSAGNAVADSPRDEYEGPVGVNGRYGNLLAEIPPGLNYSFFTEKLGHPRPVFAWRSKFSDFLYKADPERPVRTIKAQGGQYTGPFHWDNRPFSIAEFKRLQTFPDAFKIVGGRSAAIHQIGNSVPPQLARTLALSILAQVFDAKIPLDLPLLQPDDELSFRSLKRKRSAYYADLAGSSAAVAMSAAVSTPPVANRVKARAYRAEMTTGFRLLERPTLFEGMRVEFKPTQSQWLIRVTDTGKMSSEPTFSVVVSSQYSAMWSVPAERVLLEGASLDGETFTACWKAFEVELQRNHLKADLVQLCGYYQYQPLIQAELVVSGRTPWKWKGLVAVVAGRGVRQTLPTHQISQVWGIAPDKLMEFAGFLKSVGYEVRNNSTNPQIPPDHWLVPYSFPTLTHQSVQLHKELGQ